MTGRKDSPRGPNVDKTDGLTSENVPASRKRRAPLFEYPKLPRWEFNFYFLVLFGTISYAWYRIFWASRTYTWNSSGTSESYEDVKLDGHTYRKDTTDSEWEYWSLYIKKVMPWLLGHSILFNLTELIFPKWLWSPFMLTYWLLAHVMFTNRMVIGVTLAQGCLIYCIARFTRSKALTWIIGVGLLYWSSATDVFVTYDVDGYGYYVVVIIFPYKTVQYLSFVTEMLDARAGNVSEESKLKSQSQPKSTSPWPFAFFAGLYQMFWYSFYMPYSCHMIVTYKRFPIQLAARPTIKRKWSDIILFGLRILFWYLLANFLLFSCYFEAMMNSPEYLKSIPEDTLVSIGYATGQFFHLKYVVIFGVTAFFARVDNMQPFAGPICITRVALYSKMWRYFDRGLYDFFKEYIFLPICRPTFSIPRKIIGVLISYSFVLIWHGTSHQYLVWIILNISELFVETLAKVLYTIPAVRNFRERCISDRNLRRILAWLQIVPFAFGLYSNFYFLGTSESGWVFVDRIFWQETVPVKWPFILLICLGYCYNHVCMEVDLRQSQRGEAAVVGEKKEKKQ